MPLRVSSWIVSSPCTIIVWFDLGEERSVCEAGKRLERLAISASVGAACGVRRRFEILTLLAENLTGPTLESGQDRRFDFILIGKSSDKGKTLFLQAVYLYRA